MDIEIFPHRILGTDTTEKVLNDIESLDSVIRTVIQGPRLPPQDEIDRIYGDRRVIVVNGEEVELKVKTGRIFVELYDVDTLNSFFEPGLMVILLYEFISLILSMIIFLVYILILFLFLKNLKCVFFNIRIIFSIIKRIYDHTCIFFLIYMIF